MNKTLVFGVAYNKNAKIIEQFAKDCNADGVIHQDGQTHIEFYFGNQKALSDRCAFIELLKEEMFFPLRTGISACYYVVYSPGGIEIDINKPFIPEWVKL